MTDIATLSTIVKRDTLTIKSSKFPGGKVYEIASAADFGPIEWAILQQRGADVTRLQQKKLLTRKEQQRVLDYLDQMAKAAVPSLEAAVFKEMTLAQKEWLVFFWIAHINGVAEGNGKTAGSRSTGSKQSPASKRSTAATP